MPKQKAKLVRIEKLLALSETMMRAEEAKYARDLAELSAARARSDNLSRGIMEGHYTGRLAQTALRQQVVVRQQLVRQEAASSAQGRRVAQVQRQCQKIADEVRAARSRCRRHRDLECATETVEWRCATKRISQRQG